MSNIDISIIGTGNMARTIGRLAVAGGNTVEVIGRDIAKLEALARRIGGVAARGAGAAPVGASSSLPCRTPTPHQSS